MNPTRVKQIIRDQELDMLTAWTMDRSRKLDQAEGTIEDLQAVVDLMEGSLPGPYILEGSRTENTKRSGRKSKTEQPFVWHMTGVQDKPAPAPSVPVLTGGREVVRMPDVDSIKAASEALAGKAIAEYERDRLQADLEAMRAELEEEEEEEEEEDQRTGSAPWWEDEERTIRVVKEVKGLFGDLFVRRDQPAPPATSDLTDEERRIMQAIRNFKASDAATFADMKDKLLSNFLPNDEQ